MGQNELNYVCGSAGNLVTSQGPGTAFDFALRLAEILVGEAKATKVRKAMLL